MRVALYRQHRILYQPVAHGIEVLRVVHQARDFAAALQRLETVREIIRQNEERSRPQDREPDQTEP